MQPLALSLRDTTDHKLLDTWTGTGPMAQGFQPPPLLSRMVAPNYFTFEKIADSSLVEWSPSRPLRAARALTHLT
jgi:hypothetical protein